ncbi:MAG: DNA alkylation repair protein [Bacteroidales bacterium]|uniref:DNA alkylation repair protein n=1 Tax=Candidatus Cryptobacteroides sp. TaxID=2952915 RepID=UPI002A74773D|nr:DNA alkylation repair protein [Candidatus Cryptobacteroides sp.]MDD7233942.1 DNA alkylation repair protein [Bacteroidales bacterium]MDY2702231.1 DNA alkylation repair protein [Candidatus Cryptobacteroides sp.]
MENILKARMMQAGDPSLVEGLSRFFKTGKGQYGEGDRFLGIKVPVTRAIVKECWKEVSSGDLEECITSEYHEIRLAALLCLVRIFKGSRKDPSRQKECIDFYLSHTAHINNWDLVDLSCYELLGAWLVDKDRSLLFDLARDGKTIWEQRIGIVSTLAFIRRGELEECFEISDIMLAAKGRMHDLLQKATGWMLREAGKRDQARLVGYLRQRWNGIPATMRRYACEKLSVETVESLRQESITIRKSKPEDLTRLMEIFAHARSFMVSTGNPDQWAEDYPGRELLLKDIGSSDSYVVQAGGAVVATFVLRAGDDPTYRVIYDGEWPDDGPYATIHRIASDGSRKGILHLVMKFALERFTSIRIDTHRDNRVMRAAILREGFRYCGIIRCWNGTERLAYQYAPASHE